MREFIRRKWPLLVMATLPGLAAWMADHDFSSCVHEPAIGVTGIAVALCDALFGQIISQTRDLPYQYGATPEELAVSIDRLNRFHARTFWAWVFTKVFSGLAIIIPAATMSARHGEAVAIHRSGLIVAGYAVVGLSLAGTAYFLSTYFNARKADIEARRREILRRSREKDKDISPELQKQIDRQREEAFAKYNGAPASCRPVAT